MKLISILKGFGLSAVLGATTAVAADLPSRRAPVAPAPAITNFETFHPFQIRLRATAIVPDGGTNTFYDKWGQIPGVTGVSAGVPGSSIWNSSAKAAVAVIPELDLSYYFTKNIAVEAICCFTKHKVTGQGVLAGLDIGSRWLFPPTVLLQYHFTNFGAFQPYVGVGVNYTRFFGGSNGGNWQPFYTGLGLTGYNTVASLNVGDSWGVAGQVGFDYMIDDHWGVNVDVKRIMMRPSAHGVVYNAPLNLVIPVSTRLKIDPWLVSAGITYRFGGTSSAPVVAKY